jgi:hypothetical protein
LSTGTYRDEIAATLSVRYNGVNDIIVTAVTDVVVSAGSMYRWWWWWWWRITSGSMTVRIGMITDGMFV